MGWRRFVYSLLIQSWGVYRSSPSENFRATHTSQGTSSNWRNRQALTKGAQHGYSCSGQEKKEERKGKKHLLSYKARTDRQPAPRNYLWILLTCYPVEPTGISIWVFPRGKHIIKWTGISERECQTHSCLGVTVMKNDGEVLQSIQSSQKKEEVGKD